MKLGNWPPFSRKKSEDETTGAPELAERGSLEGTRGGDLDAAPAEQSRFRVVPNESIEDQTPAERARNLSETVEETTRTLDYAASKERADMREEKANKFAEKFGIADKRQDMLDAENEYADAVKELHSNTWTIGRKIPQDIQERYNASRVAWREALADAVRTGEQSDRVMAKFIGFRDTAIRPGEARKEAIKEALDEKSQRTLHKAVSWGKKGLLGALGVLKKGTLKAGEKLAGVHEKVFAKEGEKFDREKVAQNYARVVRILGGAAIATVLTGGISAAGVPFVALKIGRGLISTFGGASIGAGAGKGFDATVGESRKEDLRHTIHQKDFQGKNIIDVGAFDEQQIADEEKIWAKGNAKARAAARQKVEMYTTVAASGTFSFMTSPFFHNLLSVHNAAEQVQSPTGGLGAAEKVPGDSPTSAPAATETMRSADTFSKPTVPSEVLRSSAPDASIPLDRVAAGPANPDVGVTIHSSGEGMGKLFEDLKSSVRGSDLYDQQNTSKGLAHLLNTNPNELSHAVGKTFGENGMKMHMGDSLFVDDNQNVWFEPQGGGKPQLFIENDSSAAGFKIHELEAPKGAVVPEHAAVKAVPETQPKVPTEKPGESAPETQRVPESSTPRPDGLKGVMSSVQDQTGTQPSIPIEQPTPAPAPADVQPPVPKAPLTVPAEVAEPAPAAPVVTPESTPPAPIPSPLETAVHTITTPRGLTVDLDTPNAYSALDSQGHALIDTQGHPIAELFGGKNDDDTYAAAEDYLRSHPSSTIRFKVTLTDSAGVKTPRIVEWSSSPEGTPLMTPPNAFLDEKPLPPIDPNQFDRKLDFVYKKS